MKARPDCEEEEKQSFKAKKTNKNKTKCFLASGIFFLISVHMSAGRVSLRHIVHINMAPGFF